MPDFTGGFIGYFSYDLKNNIEKLPSKAKKGLHVPLFCFNYYLKLIYYDHVKNKCFFIKNYLMPLNNYPDLCVHYSAGDESSSSSIINIIKDDLDRERQRISACIKNTAEKPALSINQAIREKYIRRRIKKINPVSDFSREGYMEAVKKAKKYIRSGDIYQVNMTQRFSFRAELDPADLYYVLRQKNPAPFSAFISFPGIKIGCSSPERFLFLKDGIIETRPIKGTCQRGRTQEEDLRNMEELSGSIKDRAELNMIVDLERNDLGRFCRYGTVKVKEHAVVEKYAKVFHLVSTVTGSLQPGYSHADIIRAAFPGGSITGAPKIRAMEIIDELEPCARNIYTGSIGYIGIDGTMDLNIVIRSFIIKGRKFYYNVGGGIVADSVPETEFQETLDKGAALKETLDFFQGSN
jgi:aminodeoxychorismate synthase component I